MCKSSVYDIYKWQESNKNLCQQSQQKYTPGHFSGLVHLPEASDKMYPVLQVQPTTTHSLGHGLGFGDSQVSGQGEGQDLMTAFESPLHPRFSII